MFNRFLHGCPHCGLNLRGFDADARHAHIAQCVARQWCAVCGEHRTRHHTTSHPFMAPAVISASTMDELNARLARIERLVQRSVRASEADLEIDVMAQRDIDALKAQVTKNGEVSASAVTLIQGLAQQIRDAADDPDELATLAAALDAQAKSLGDAVAANTPAAPPTT